MPRDPGGSDEFLTPEQMSARLQLSVRAVQRLANMGRLRGVRIGKKWRFPRKCLDELAFGKAADPSTKILVVDDDVEILSVIRRLLRREGYEVICCETGRLAIEVLQQEDGPDLMLLDLLLPDIKGPDVLQWMQEKKINIPVLLVTAYADSELMEQALSYGVCSLLKKPFSPEDLISAVKMLVAAGERMATAAP